MINLIREMREQTGLSVMECKRALEESNGDVKKAHELVRTRLVSKIKDGELANGHIASYVHNGRIGALVEVNCETDFTSRSNDFRELCNDIAKQIVGTNPGSVEELLKQEFIKDTSMTIGTMIDEMSAKCGEGVKIAHFVRYETSGKVINREPDVRKCLPRTNWAM